MHVQQQELVFCVRIGESSPKGYLWGVITYTEAQIVWEHQIHHVTSWDNLNWRSVAKFITIYSRRCYWPHSVHQYHPASRLRELHSRNGARTSAVYLDRSGLETCGINNRSLTAMLRAPRPDARPSVWGEIFKENEDSCHLCYCQELGDLELTS